MSNEEKILSMLTKMQADILETMRDTLTTRKKTLSAGIRQLSMANYCLDSNLLSICPIVYYEIIRGFNCEHETFQPRRTFELRQLEVA